MTALHFPFLFLFVAADAGSDEVAIERVAQVDAIVRLALARNPELDESRLRAEAVARGGRAAARLPDPELKYEQWGVPLDRPFALGRAETLMIGVRQSLPAWGTRKARARLADRETEGGRADVRTRRLDLVLQVRRAFADYARSDHELGLHRAHVALTGQVVELARLGYEAGRGTQQDVLRLELELARLHADIARIEQEKRSSAALLNALMSRPPGAPLGPAPAPAAPAPPLAISDLERGLETRRAEVAAAASAVGRGQAAVDLARAAGRYPTVMVGVDYWYMPTGHTSHGYGAMVAVSLPWLGSRRTEELAAAESSLRADQRALDAARIAAGYELADAAARLEGARRGFEVVDRDLLPHARRSHGSAQAAFSAGQGDALGVVDSLRSLLQVQVERLRALSRIESAAADLDRAAGKEAP